MYNIRCNSSGNITLNNIFVIFIIILSIFGVTPILFNFKVILLLWCVYLFLFHFIKKKEDKTLREISKLGLLYALITFLYKFLGISSASYGYCMGSIPFFFAPFATTTIFNISNQNKIKILFHIISFVIILNIIDGIRLFIKYPMEGIAFQNISEQLALEGITNLNIGSSMFVNMTVFFLAVLQFSFYKAKNKTEKILFGSYFCITMWFIVMCTGKASAVVIAFISIFLQYIAHYKKLNSLKTIIRVIMISLVFFLFINEIIDFIIEITGSDRLASRLLYFTSDNTGASDEGQVTVEARSNLWLVSIETWIKNPFTFLFGTGDHDPNDFISTAASGIGNHSDLLDVFSRYGLLGGILLYGIVIKYYKILNRKFCIFKYEILSFFIVLIIMGVTKKFVALEQSIIIFILLPLALRYFSFYKNT